MQPLYADWIVLDSSDTQDWVRVMEQSYPKYKDTMIRPNGMIKFQTGDIPEDAKVTSAHLYFYVIKSAPNDVITISHVTNDSWSFDSTAPEQLYQWPVESKIATYNTGFTGWKLFDVTEAMQKDRNPKSVQEGASTTHFSIKFTPTGPYFPWERIASPGCDEGSLRPYLHVMYTDPSSISPPDLTLFDSSIETDPVWPKPGDEVTLKAKIRNIGAINAYNVRVNFYDGDPTAGGALLGYDIVPYLSGGGDQVDASISWKAQMGRHKFFVVVDPLQMILEKDELNNYASNIIPVLKSYNNYNESFEFGFGDWVYDFDTPKEYQTGRNRLSFIHPTRDQAYKSKQSLFAFLDGCGDDGTIWIERSVPVPRYSNITVKFSFAFGIQSDIATTIMYFMDLYNPEVEVDFNEAGMHNGWNYYSFKKKIYTGSRNRLWLGGGYSARWETLLSKYMDAFTVSITKDE